MPASNSRLMQLTLPSIGVNVRVLTPAEPTPADASLITPGTVLLGTGRSHWDWGERHLVHAISEEGNLTCIDLVRHIVITMKTDEAHTSCLCILHPEDEPYPYQTVEEALEASRKGLPLFSAPTIPAPPETDKG